MYCYDSDVVRNTLSYNEANREYNRINQALLEIVRRSIRDADIGPGSLDDDDPVERFAKRLDRSGRPALGLLDMVNCDRKDSASFLWKTFDRQLEKGQKIQFYFLPACPSQRPDILAERFTYELLKDELKSQEARLRIHRREDNRLLVEELPIGARLRTACAAFKTYFAERFDLGAADTVFEDYLRTGLPALPYDYVVLAFRLDHDQWDQEVMEGYFAWLLEAFSQAQGKIPCFLFFFVIRVEKAHFDKLPGSALKAVLDGCRAIADKHADKAEFLEPLPPVAAEDLDAWLGRVARVETKEKKALRDLLSARMTEEHRQYCESLGAINMEDIHYFQKLFYQHHHNK